MDTALAFARWDRATYDHRAAMARPSNQRSDLASWVQATIFPSEVVTSVPHGANTEIHWPIITTTDRARVTRCSLVLRHLFRRLHDKDLKLAVLLTHDFCWVPWCSDIVTNSSTASSIA